MLNMTGDDSSSTDNHHLALLLISRLERLSADSYWAHQASGLRGSLLRRLEQEMLGTLAEDTLRESEREKLITLIERGFEILEKAARGN